MSNVNVYVNVYVNVNVNVYVNVIEFTRTYVYLL